MVKKYAPEVRCGECNWRPTRTADGLCFQCAQRKELVRPANQPTEDQLARFYEWVQRKADELGVTVDDLEDQGFPVSKSEYAVWWSLHGRDGDEGERAGEGGDQAAAAKRRAVVGEQRTGDVRPGVRVSGGPEGQSDVRQLSVRVAGQVGSGDPPAGGGPGTAVAGECGGRRAAVRRGVGRTGDVAGPAGETGSAAVQGAGATLLDYLKAGVETLWPRGVDCRFQPLDRVVLVRRVAGYAAGCSGDVLRAEPGPCGVTYTLGMGGRLEVEVDEEDLRPWMTALN